MNWFDALGNAGAGAVPVLERGRQLQLEKDRLAQQNAQFQQSQGLQQQSLDIAKANQAMAQEQHNLQVPMLQRQVTAAQRQDQLMDLYRKSSALQDRLNSGEDHNVIANEMTKLYNTHPAAANGDYAGIAHLNGAPHIINGGVDGPTHATPLTADTVKGYLTGGLDDVRKQLATTSPEALAAYNAAQTQAAQHRENIQMQEKSWRNNAADRLADREAQRQTQLEMARMHYGSLAAARAGRPLSARETMQDRVDAYTDALVNSGKFPDRNAAAKHAWGVILKDPEDAKSAAPHPLVAAIYHGVSQGTISPEEVPAKLRALEAAGLLSAPGAPAAPLLPPKSAAGQTTKAPDTPVARGLSWDGTPLPPAVTRGAPQPYGLQVQPYQGVSSMQAFNPNQYPD